MRTHSARRQLHWNKVILNHFHRTTTPLQPCSTLTVLNWRRFKDATIGWASYDTRVQFKNTMNILGHYQAVDMGFFNLRAELLRLVTDATYYHSTLRWFQRGPNWQLVEWTLYSVTYLRKSCDCSSLDTSIIGWWGCKDPPPKCIITNRTNPFWRSQQG